MGKSKGRRLKRYLGLRRSQRATFQGGIDRLLPGKLTGWVVSVDPESPFYEVRLLVGSNLISRVEINQPRPDVCELLGRQVNPGFVLSIPFDLPPIDWQLPVRVLAVSFDGSAQVELSLLQNKKKVTTSELLRLLLQSDQRGMDGHVDGIKHGMLTGWAGCGGQSSSSTIWLQSDGLDPISINCNQFREGITDMNASNYCGFSLPLDSLPESWYGKNIWCTFDQSGQWNLPQDQSLSVPALLGGITSTSLQHYSENTQFAFKAYADQTALSPHELQEHWRVLEDFRLFLDRVEQELNSREIVEEKKGIVKPKLSSWFNRFLRSSR